MYEAAAHLTFGLAGNAATHLVSGFSWPEDGHTWALGPEAVLLINLRPGEGDLMLEVSLRPFMIPPYKVRQRVGLFVQGTEIGTEWAQDDTVLGFRIPAFLVAGRTELDVRLALPDAMSPAEAHINADDRPLACQMRELLVVWIPPEPPTPPRRMAALKLAPDDPPERVGELVRFCTGLDLPVLMEHLESLGNTCEFGLVQRACGADPQGLLRFVGIRIHHLLHALDFGFEGVDDPALIRAYPSPEGEPEWLLRNDRYGMDAHSFITVKSIDEAALIRQQTARMKLQRRRLLEVLETGQNLFVFRQQEHMTEAHALPILTLLRSYGPNALLFVTEDREKPSGSVDQIGAHLFRGNIDQLAPAADARHFKLLPWISICANAYRLWRETGHGS
jgi:hypothetical protein